jgi:hypothetical protein
MAVKCTQCGALTVDQCDCVPHIRTDNTQVIINQQTEIKRLWDLLTECHEALSMGGPKDLWIKIDNALEQLKGKYDDT